MGNVRSRPICRGKLSTKTEFGYRAVLAENEQRLITHYAGARG